MKNLATSICLSIVLISFSKGSACAEDVQAKSDQVKHVDAAAAATLLAKRKDVVVLDIRTPGEFKGGHIAGAKNIDFYGSDFANKIRALDKSKSYLVHCASGGRSTRSLKVFKELNFKSIYHLDGGFKGWVKAGEPVEK